MALLEDWNCAQVSEWLTVTGLASYVPAFLEQGVDGALLAALDDDMLAELGMTSKLQRRKLVIKRDAAIRDGLRAAPIQVRIRVKRQMTEDRGQRGEVWRERRDIERERRGERREIELKGAHRKTA